MMLIANNVALSVILCLLSIICLPLLGFALRDVEPRDGMPERHSRVICTLNHILSAYLIFAGICMAVMIFFVGHVPAGWLWAFLAFTALAAAIVFAWALCNMDSVGAIVLYVISIGLMYLLMHDIMKALGLGILWHMLAICIPIATIGFAVAKYFWDYGKFLEYESAGERGHGYKMFATILYIVTTILLIAAIIFGMIAPKQPDPDQDDQDGDTAATEPSGDGYRQWPYFLNDELQENDDKADDYFFGYATDVEKDIDYQTKDFYSRSGYDPMFVSGLATGIKACTDINMADGALYYGYEERNSVLEEADAVTKILSQDKELFDRTSNAIREFFHERTTKVEWKKIKIQNQIYAVPRKENSLGIPKLILAESEVEEDWCLVYHLQYGKGQEATMVFRHGCGWQWVNAAEVLGIEPEPNPINSGSSNPSGGSDTPSNPKTNPTEKPNPPQPTEPRYNKDKSLSDNSGVNDNPGEGKSTNNGDGAKGSTDDVNGGNGTSRNYYEEEQRHEADDASANKSSTPSHDGGGGTIDNAGGSDDRPLSTPKDSEIANDTSNPHWNTSGV